MVEIIGDTFVAGVWDGPFADLGMLDATTVMGSGGRAANHGIAFCNATHPFDDLYSVLADDVVHISNSLPLLFASTDDGPDIHYRAYQSDRVARWHAGTATSPSATPTRRGREILVHTATDFVISLELEMTTTHKPVPPEPHRFTEYREMLATTVRRVVENATDGARHHPLKTLATLSAGYDSAASAVLGAEAGIRDAITFTTSGHADSGTPIGKVLGMSVVEYDPAAWRDLSSEPEIEVAASASGSTVAALAVLDDGWNCSLVLNGGLGDDIWDVMLGDLGDGLSQSGAGTFVEASLHEYALRAGVVFFFIPTIGAVQYKEIRRITESDEMKPWIVGESYQRPIPRRIIEEAGVPRGSFATRKRAGAAVYTDTLLGPGAHADFEQFWATALSAQPPVRRLWYRTQIAIGVPLAKFFAGALFKLNRWLGVRKRMRLWVRHRAAPLAFRFNWAVGRLIDRYAAELAAPPPDSRPVVPADSL